MIKRYKKDEIEKLAKILKNDGVISVPTDSTDEIKILREGPISLEQIIVVIKEEICLNYIQNTSQQATNQMQENTYQKE